VHVHHTLIVSRPADAAAALEPAVRALRDGTAAPPVDEDALPGFLALLAAGLFDSAGTLLRQAGAGSPDPLALAAAAGRYVAWTGDLRSAAALWGTARSALDVAASSPDNASARRFVLLAGALAGLERTATDLGDPAGAARAHSLARTARGRLDGLQLDKGDRLLADALAVAPLMAGAIGEGPARKHAGGDVAIGTDAASTVLRFVHQTLAAEPDASRHRLRLQPAPRELALQELAFGDGSVALTISVEQDTVTFVLEQESGAIPVTALLEPRLAELPAAAEVDGRTAELRPRRVHGGFVLPVQIVLDAPRTLTLRMQ
jgi:hypothetical protein